MPCNLVGNLLKALEESWNTGNEGLVKEHVDLDIPQCCEGKAVEKAARIGKTARLLSRLSHDLPARKDCCCHNPVPEVSTWKGQQSVDSTCA